MSQRQSTADAVDMLAVEVVVVVAAAVAVVVIVVVVVDELCSHF